MRCRNAERPSMDGTRLASVLHHSNPCPVMSLLLTMLSLSLTVPPPSCSVQVIAAFGRVDGSAELPSY